MSRPSVPIVLRTVRKEVLQWARDPWVASTVFVVTALILFAAIAGSWTAASRARATVTAQHEEYARWLAQPPRDPHSASHFGMTVFHTPSRLSAFDPGVSPYVGTSLFLEAHKQNQPASPESADTGAASRLGQVHLASALETWIPLVIIVLSAGAFAAEREQGTLAQVMSMGVHPATLAAGKMLATGIIVAIIVLPGAAVSFAIASTMPHGGPWPGDAIVRLSVLAAGYAAYFALWILVTVTISAAVRSWRVAAAASIALWCVAAIVAPRAAIDRARVTHPLPSRAVVEREILDARLQRGKRFAREKAELLRSYGVSSEKDLPVDFSVLWLQRTEARDNQLIDEHAARLDRVYRAEHDAYLHAAWLSPAIAIDLLSTAASGTDEWHYRDFLQQGEQYRREMMIVLNGALVRRPGEKRPMGTAALWSTLPPFAFTIPPLSEDARPVGIAIAALAVWLTIGIVAAIAILRRVPAAS